MLKRILFFNFIFFILFSTNIFADMDKPENFENVNYYEYIPDNVNKFTPILFAFHGVGSSFGDEISGEGFGTFRLYTEVYNKTVIPNCIIVYLTKNNGCWDSELASNFVIKYIEKNNLKGNVFYYGFSMGAYNGLDIINACDGIFDGAIFVDGSFVNGSYYNKLKGLKKILSIRGFCGNNDSDIQLFNTFCCDNNIFFNDISVNLSHSEINKFAVLDCNLFDFIKNDFKNKYAEIIPKNKLLFHNKNKEFLSLVENCHTFKSTLEKQLIHLKLGYYQ